MHEWGDPQATPILLCHGMFDHARGFDLLAPRLAERFRDGSLAQTPLSTPLEIHSQPFPVLAVRFVHNHRQSRNREGRLSRFAFPQERFGYCGMHAWAEHVPGHRRKRLPLPREHQVDDHRGRSVGSVIRPE